MITIYESNDLGKFEIVKSILSANNIDYLTAGEGLQDLLGAGRIGGYNILTGPAQIAVPEADLETARELLKDFIEE